MKNQYYSEFGTMAAQADAEMRAATNALLARAQAMNKEGDEEATAGATALGKAAGKALADETKPTWGTDTQSPAYQSQRVGERASY